MIVFAAELACACSPNALVIGPGFPMKFSKKCCRVPVVPAFCVCVTTPPTRWTPPPIDVSPKPSLYSHRNQATSTSENPANIIASTFTAHFLGTRDAYSTARAGRLIRPTKVAAVICHVLSAGLSQLGYGTYEVAPIRWITQALLTVIRPGVPLNGQSVTKHRVRLSQSDGSPRRRHNAVREFPHGHACVSSVLIHPRRQSIG